MGASHWVGLVLPDLVQPMTPPAKAVPSKVVSSSDPMALRRAAGRFKPFGELDGHWGAELSTDSIAVCSPGSDHEDPGGWGTWVGNKPLTRVAWKRCCCSG